METENQLEYADVVAGILYLLQWAPDKLAYKLETFEKRFLNSIRCGQFRMYHKNGLPYGFINWAWLDNTREEKFKTGQYHLEEDEWNCGEKVWFPEALVPSGDFLEIGTDLRSNIFTHAETGHWLEEDSKSGELYVRTVSFHEVDENDVPVPNHLRR